MFNVKILSLFVAVAMVILAITPQAQAIDRVVGRTRTNVKPNHHHTHTHTHHHGRGVGYALGLGLGVSYGTILVPSVQAVQVPLAAPCLCGPNCPCRLP